MLLEVGGGVLASRRFCFILSLGVPLKNDASHWRGKGEEWAWHNGRGGIEVKWAWQEYELGVAQWRGWHGC
jgi:hypothetical protein